MNKIANNANLVGERFARLVVIELAGKNKHGKRLWRCKCDCGGSAIVETGGLRSGNTHSCGCYRNERAAEGMRKAAENLSVNHPKEYSAWKAMKQRCQNEKNYNYKNYGARGIKVCARWLEGFKNFYEDMGPSPKGGTLDRIDVNGDYNIDNCRWVSNKIQQRNRRNNVWVTYKGKRMSVPDWGDLYGLPYETIRDRLKRGWSVERALTEPVRRKAL